jgi:hypothetical protein
MDILTQVLDKIEKTIEVGSMLNLFEVGLALKVLEDRLWSIDDTLAQRCNNLQHKIFGE